MFRDVLCDENTLARLVDIHRAPGRFWLEPPPPKIHALRVCEPARKIFEMAAWFRKRVKNTRNIQL